MVLGKLIVVVGESSCITGGLEPFSIKLAVFVESFSGTAKHLLLNLTLQF